MASDGVEQAAEELEVGAVYRVEINTDGAIGFFIGKLRKIVWSEAELVTLLRFDWGELTEFDACIFYNLSSEG